VCKQNHLCNNTTIQSGIKDVLALLLLILIHTMSLGRKQEQFKITVD